MRINNSISHISAFLCIWLVFTVQNGQGQSVQIDGRLHVHGMDTVASNTDFIIHRKDGTLGVSPSSSAEALIPPVQLSLSPSYVHDVDNPARFYKFRSRIYLLGKIKKNVGTIASNDVIATLPPQSRPNKRHVLHAKSGGINIRLNVEQNGDLRVISSPSQPTDSLTLQGIDFFHSEKVRDIAGNKYQTIVIGTQEWFMENLRTDKYNDGTSISNITGQSAWNNATSGAWCWYNNSQTHDIPNGKFYNFEAVQSGKLCPTGWRVPSNEDWTTLSNYLGGNGAGYKLKDTGNTYWFSNDAATNESGFAARGDGYRDHEGFRDLRASADWWSSTADHQWHYSRGLKYTHSIFALSADPNTPVNGYAVRCLKN